MTDESVYGEIRDLRRQIDKLMKAVLPQKMFIVAHREYFPPDCYGHSSSYLMFAQFSKTTYYGKEFGYLHTWHSNRKEASRFKTKKEAIEHFKQFGSPKEGQEYVVIQIEVQPRYDVKFLEKTEVPIE